MVNTLIEAPRQAVHDDHVADLSKHPYATGPALNLLTQPIASERYQLSAFGNQYILSSWRGLCKCWLSPARVVKTSSDTRSTHTRSRRTSEWSSIAHVTASAGKFEAAPRPTGQRRSKRERLVPVRWWVVTVSAQTTKWLRSSTPHARRTGARFLMKCKSGTLDERFVCNRGPGQRTLGQLMYVMHARVEAAR
jgi:hypothetical protein